MTHRGSRIVVVLMIGVLHATAAAGQTAAGLDQHQVDSSVSGLIHSANLSGQWFTVGRSGLLWGVEFSLEATIGVTENLVVEVEDVSGGLPGVVLGTTTVTPADLGPMPDTLDLDMVTATLIDLHHLDIFVAPGDLIGVRLSTAQVTSNGYRFMFQGSTDPYPGGEMLSNSGSNVDSDLAFKTFVADPIFRDGFELGDTSEWTTTVPP
jgi:hypothetical protein